MLRLALITLRQALLHLLHHALCHHISEATDSDSSSAHARSSTFAHLIHWNGMMGSAVSRLNSELCGILTSELKSEQGRNDKQPRTDEELRREEEASFISSLSPHLRKHYDSNPAYAVRPSPGKGQGMFATRALQPGELILSELPLIKLKRDDLSYYRLEWLVSLLTSEERAAYLALHHTGMDELPSILEIWRKNCFAVSGECSAVFATLSKMNNSCNPNISISWDDEDQMMNVYASKEVKEGEELGFCYHGLLRERNERRETLRTGWEFDCRCTTCDLKGEELQKSNFRRGRIQHALGLLDCAPQYTDDQLSMIEDVLELLREEGLPCQMISFSWHAYQLAAFHSRWDDARYWASLAYEHSVLANGRYHHTTRLAEEGMSKPRFVEFGKTWGDTLRESCVIS